MRNEIKDIHMLPSEEVQAGAQRMFPGVAFHWTIQNYGMTYGGLHETKASAEESKKALVASERHGLLDDILSNGVKAAFQHLKEWKDAPIIQLNNGDQYVPWATGGRIYTHGVNDGAHDSIGPLKAPPESSPARLLRPHNGF